MTIQNSSEIKFLLDPEREITLATAPGVFTPTTTTNLLIQAVQKSISGKHTLLDLGCGTGVVGLSLYNHGLVKPPLYASDLSVSAVQCSRKNFDRYGCQAEVLGGSLFEPWKGKKFDVIVDDISGVAEDVAIVSPWFEGIPVETGRGGTDLIVDIIRNAPNYLVDGGLFFFPVLSLSNADLLLEEAKKVFNNVELVSRLEWPLPAELKPHLTLLRTLASEGNIKLQERFGMIVCYTEIYCACTP